MSARSLFSSASIWMSHSSSAPFSGAQFLDLVAELGPRLFEQLVGDLDAAAHRVDAVGERRDFGAGALDVIEVLGAQVGVRALLVGERLFEGGDALLVALGRRFVLGDAPQRRLEPLGLGLAGLAQADVVLRRQRPLVARLLERQLHLGEALVAGGEFAAQPPDLVGLGRRATRFRLQGALGLLARRGAFAHFALRGPERRLDALKPLAQLAIVALGGGGGGGGRFAFRLRSGVTRGQAGVGVLDQRMLGFQLLQPRLAGLEFDQQVGQRRQQGVELLARPFGAGEPVADLLELGA